MMRVAAIYGLLPAGETIVTYTTACRVYVEDTLLHRVSRLIFVLLPAGGKGDEPKASSKHWRANCTRGEPKNPNKSADFPPPAVSAQHLLLLTVLQTKVGRFRPYIASKRKNHRTNPPTQRGKVSDEGKAADGKTIVRK